MTKIILKSAIEKQNKTGGQNTRQNDNKKVKRFLHLVNIEKLENKPIEKITISPSEYMKEKTTYHNVKIRSGLQLERKEGLLYPISGSVLITYDFSDKKYWKKKDIKIDTDLRIISI